MELDKPADDPEALRFRKLRVRGTFEIAGQILIENRRRGNRIGFHVITPLRILGSDRRVLVNRGGERLGSVLALPPPGALSGSDRCSDRADRHTPEPRRCRRLSARLAAAATQRRQTHRLCDPVVRIRLHCIGAVAEVQPRPFRMERARREQRVWGHWHLLHVRMKRLRHE